MRCNLATAIAAFRRETRQTTGLSSDAGVGDAYIKDLLNSAWDWIADRLRVDKAASLANLSAGVPTVSAPVDRIGWAIDSVEILSQDGSRWIPLARRTRTNAEDVYNILDTQRDEPQAWAWSLSDRTKIELFPTPARTVASGLRFLFNTRPRLHRLYNRTNISATFTLASDAVTLSATPPTGAIAIGDAIGMVPATQSDGTTADPTGLPVAWYPIANIVGAAVTLGAAFEEEGEGSGKRFMTAQVHPIEQLMPGKLGDAPVFRALQLHYGRQSPELSKFYADQANAIVLPLTPDEPNVVLPGPDVRRFPWLGGCDIIAPARWGNF